MLKRPAFALLFFSALAFAQDTENHTITINGETFEYTLGTHFEYDATKKGPISIRVDQKPMQTYNDGVIRFQYGINFPVSETLLDEGVKQISSISSSGLGVFIQEYEGIDPSLLIDLMLNEVTKESVEYGYSQLISPVEITSKDGKLLTGKKAVLEYQGMTDEWTVVTYAWKDAGVLIVSMATDVTNTNKSSDYIDSFFNSLEILAETP